MKLVRNDKGEAVKIQMPFNSGLFNKVISSLESFRNDLQTITDLYNKISSIDELLTIDKLEALLQNPDTYIAEQFTKGKPLKVLGFTVNPAKIFNFIDKPEQLDYIVREVKILNDRAKGNFAKTELHKFNLEGETISIKNEVREQVKKDCTPLIDSPRIKQIDRAEKIANEINALCNELNIHKEGRINALKLLFKGGGDGISADYYRLMNR